MNSNERVLLCRALKKTGYPEMSGFTIEVFHDMRGDNDKYSGYWEIVLVPMLSRIYFISELFATITLLDIHVAIFTDLYRPGCIIIH